MAKYVATSRKLSLGGTALDAYIKSASLEMESDVQEVTNMDSAGWKEFLAGLKSGKLSFELMNDSDTSTLNALLWGLLGTVAAFLLRGTDAAIASTNEEWGGNVVVNSFTPINANVGDVPSVSYSFQTTGAITRDVTP